jgi:TonB family protein
MSTPATIPTKPELFDRYVRKFRSICEMHGIQFGSHENLPEFVHRLADDRYFAMDFWAFTGRLSRREEGDLTDEQMLALIIEGIAGDEVPDANGELKDAIAELAALLAGVDVQSPLQNQVDPAPFPHTDPESSTGKDGKETTGHGSEMPWRASSLQAAFLSDAMDRDAGTAPPLSSALSTQLEDTLRRLQASNLELKQQLNEIDKKMSRLEPHPDELTPKGIPTKPTPKPEEQAPIPSVENFARDRGGKARLVLKPDVSPHPELVAGESHRPELFATMFSTKKEKKNRDDHDEWNSTPHEFYVEQRGSHGVSLFVVLVLLVIGATFFLQRNGAPLRVRYAPLIQRVQGAIDDRLGVSSTKQNTASIESVASNAGAISGMGSAEKSAGAPESGAKGKSANQSAARDFSSPRGPAPASNSVSDQAKATGSDERQAAEAKTDSRINRRATMSRSQAQAEEAALADRGLAATDASRAQDGTPVNVAPSVMEANLVLSRVPAYPDVARADRVQGPVVVKAIISRAGTVQDVHVIQGDPLLRNAAAEAIYKWRYRPYLLNGRPVEVATTITIDFRLSR